MQVWTLVFVTMSVVCYVVPVALLTWMYLRIYSAAHRNSQRTRRASLTHSASELVVHCLGSSQTISGSVVQVNGSSYTNSTGANTGSTLFAASANHSWVRNDGHPPALPVAPLTNRNPFDGGMGLTVRRWRILRSARPAVQDPVASIHLESNRQQPPLPHQQRQPLPLPRGIQSR